MESKKILIFIGIIILITIFATIYFFNDKNNNSQLPKNASKHSVLLSELAVDLRRGDMKSAATKFAPNNKNDILMELDSEGQKQLADWVENSQLTTEKDNYVVYKTQWVDESGETNSIEFILSKDNSGQWKIISW